MATIEKDTENLSINWNNIRAIEGQREGFEELVCQLAGQEIVPDQVLFTRIGKPDGGKECYWELNNGDIYCWQARIGSKTGRSKSLLYALG